MNPFEQSIFERCRRVRRTICLPEADDQRVEDAVVKILMNGFSESVVVWSKDFSAFKNRVSKKLTGPVDSVCIDGSTLASSVQSEFETYLTRHYQSKKKTVDSKLMQTQLMDPLFQAGYLLQIGKVDCVVAGSIATTADVIRAALNTVGTADGIKTICGGFVMTKGNSVLIFADGAVLIEPTSDQLCDVAAASVGLWSKISTDAARVAFLSFSTKGSATHLQVEKVQKAFELFRTRNPNIIADGELQFDTAFVPDVAQRKAPASVIKGQANIFIFPDLNSGNIGYKMAQRLGGFQAYGPLLLGLKKPYSDLSRGASVDDIVMAACISACRV